MHAVLVAQTMYDSPTVPYEALRLSHSFGYCTAVPQFWPSGDSGQNIETVIFTAILASLEFFKRVPILQLSPLLSAVSFIRDPRRVPL